MDSKKLREAAFKQAVTILREHNERKRYGDKFINPFVIATFMQGVDVTLALIKDFENKQKP